MITHFHLIVCPRCMNQRRMLAAYSIAEEMEDNSQLHPYRHHNRHEYRKIYRPLCTSYLLLNKYSFHFHRSHLFTWRQLLWVCFCFSPSLSRYLPPDNSELVTWACPCVTCRLRKLICHLLFHSSSTHPQLIEIQERKNTQNVHAPHDAEQSHDSRALMFTFLWKSSFHETSTLSINHEHEGRISGGFVSIFNNRQPMSEQSLCNFSLHIKRISLSATRLSVFSDKETPHTSLWQVVCFIALTYQLEIRKERVNWSLQPLSYCTCLKTTLLMITRQDDVWTRRRNKILPRIWRKHWRRPDKQTCNERVDPVMHSMPSLNTVDDHSSRFYW